MDRPGVSLNSVTYRWPTHPVVVVCIDGGDPAYFEQGVRDGVVPHVARFLKQGFGAVADGDMPSFTCPNNMSIATGAPPAVHGISGNFYLDRATGEAVVMTGPELLRSRTLMAEFSRRGARVVSITAKDKLRRQLGKDMDLTGGSVAARDRDPGGPRSRPRPGHEHGELPDHGPLRDPPRRQRRLRSRLLRAGPGLAPRHAVRRGALVRRGRLPPGARGGHVRRAA